MVSGLNSKLKLSKTVLKKYEPKLGLYFFYNAETEQYWQSEYTIGSIISALDGSLTLPDVVDIVSANNPNVKKEEIQEVLEETCNFLLKEGYLVEQN